MHVSKEDEPGLTVVGPPFRNGYYPSRIQAREYPERTVDQPIVPEGEVPEE